MEFYDISRSPVFFRSAVLVNGHWCHWGRGTEVISLASAIFSHYKVGIWEFQDLNSLLPKNITTFHDLETRVFHCNISQNIILPWHKWHVSRFHDFFLQWEVSRKFSRFGRDLGGNLYLVLVTALLCVEDRLISCWGILLKKHLIFHQPNGSWSKLCLREQT